MNSMNCIEKNLLSRAISIVFERIKCINKKIKMLDKTKEYASNKTYIQDLSQPSCNVEQG